MFGNRDWGLGVGVLDWRAGWKGRFGRNGICMVLLPESRGREERQRRSGGLWGAERVGLIGFEGLARSKLLLRGPRRWVVCYFAG